MEVEHTMNPSRDVTPEPPKLSSLCCGTAPHLITWKRWLFEWSKLKWVIANYEPFPHLYSYLKVLHIIAEKKRILYLIVSAFETSIKFVRQPLV